MNETELSEAIDQLIAARSNEDLIGILARYPALLHPQTFHILTESAMTAAMNQQDDTALEMAEIADLLLSLRDQLSPQESTLSLSVWDEEESEDSLLKLLRKYCATKSVAVFNQAVFKARRSGDEKLFRILRAFASGYSVIANLLLSHYLELDRDSISREKLLTLLLLKADSLAVTVESIDKTRMAEDDMLEMLGSGIDATTSCLQLSAELEDEPCQAYYWHLLGHGFENKNEYESAEQYFSRSLTLYKKTSVEAPGIYEWWIGHVFACLGVIQFDTGNFLQAEVSFSKAIEGFDSSYSFELDKKKRREILSSIALMNYNLGNVRIDLGKLIEAEMSYQSSLELNLKLSQDPNTDFAVAKSLFGLGLAEWKLKKLEEAESSFLEALHIYGNVDGPLDAQDELSLVRTHNGLGSVQFELNKFHAAEENFLVALDIFGKYAKLQPTFFNSKLAAVYFNLGNVRLEIEDYKTAEAYYLKSFQLHQNLARPDYRAVAMVLFNVGVLRGKSGDFENSIKPLEDAIKLFSHVNDIQSHSCVSSISLAKINLGVAKSELGKFAESTVLIREGVALIESVAQLYPQVYELDLANAYNNVGQMYVRENKQESFVRAVEFFEKARTTIEDRLAKTVSPNLKRQLFRHFHNLYYTLLLCYAGLGEWEKALEIAETGKSRSLSDLLSLKTFRPRFSLDRAPTDEELKTLESLADEYQNVLRELHLIENGLVSRYQLLAGINRYIKSLGGDAWSSDDPQHAQLKREILEGEKAKAHMVHERDSRLEQIRLYDKNFPPKAKTLDAGEIFAICKESNRVAVLLRVTEKGTYIFVVFPDGTLEPLISESFTLKRLDVLWKEWLGPYSKFRSGDKYSISTQLELLNFINNMKPFLATIYVDLLKPLHDLLRKPEFTKYRELLFVPSLGLAMFPLHACCWNEEDGTTKYLLDEYTISYSTSVSIFKHAWEIEKKRERRDKFLFVTNPQKDNEAESLEFADSEVDAIMKILDLSGSKSSKHLNLQFDQATQENVKREMAGDYSLLHFACHGAYFVEDPLSSPLSLADGSLTIGDIMQISTMNAWLTTLSACETSQPDFTQATDDYYGFPFGFVLADCPSVWGSLWSVDDKATSELMAMAYQFLKDTKFESKPRALQLAQISYRKKYEKQIVKEDDFDYSSPFFWAGFQNYGV
jgi:CHAT domain-containing protein/TPR repeat protein